MCCAQAGVIFVTTHDSIGLGEDGPTHQPIEHLASLRAMPNILMIRPGDGNETAGAYKVGLSHNASLSMALICYSPSGHHDLEPVNVFAIMSKQDSGGFVQSVIGRCADASAACGQWSP